MSFSDLFGTGEHSRNLGHFASIVTLASVDGEINPEEEKVLKRLARKLDINEEDYAKIIKNASGFPINPPNTTEKRLERSDKIIKRSNQILGSLSFDDYIYLLNRK